MRYEITFGYAAGRADMLWLVAVYPESGCNTLAGGAHGQQHVIHGRRHLTGDGGRWRLGVCVGVFEFDGRLDLEWKQQLAHFTHRSESDAADERALCSCARSQHARLELWNV